MSFKRNKKFLFIDNTVTGKKTVKKISYLWLL